MTGKYPYNLQSVKSRIQMILCSLYTDLWTNLYLFLSIWEGGGGVKFLLFDWFYVFRIFKKNFLLFFLKVAIHFEMTFPVNTLFVYIYVK